MRVNYSNGQAYHSQRNNAIVPSSSCNTTSMIMALKQAGIALPDTGRDQPEDVLSAHLRTVQAYAAIRRLAPWAVNKYPPQEVHSVLQWGVNDWVGAIVDNFRTDWDLKDLIVAMESGNGVVLSGRFPMPSADLGHIVSLAGYETREETPEIMSWIVDDPFGDWRTGYTSHRGNDVSLSVDQFRKIFVKDSGIWAHIVGNK